MKLHIPTVGEYLYLSEDWKFNLYNERRNSDILKNPEIIDDESNLKEAEISWLRKLFPAVCSNINTKLAGNKLEYTNVILPQFTVLKISRIYIRGNGATARSFDSYTFTIVSSPNPLLKKGRFWAKLKDVNTMEAIVIDEDFAKSINKKSKNKK